MEEHAFGETIVVPLKPNGADLQVTNDCLIEYIYLVANYYLRLRFQQQIRAFRRGEVQ
jgi:hypothetical protein